MATKNGTYVGYHRVRTDRRTLRTSTYPSSPLADPTCPLPYRRPI